MSVPPHKHAWKTENWKTEDLAAKIKDQIQILKSHQYELQVIFFERFLPANEDLCVHAQSHMSNCVATHLCIKFNQLLEQTEKVVEEFSDKCDNIVSTIISLAQ